MERRITIHDVARAANCSIATVSLVLSGSGRIGVDRRKDILALIKQMGYRPNISGRNLRRRRTDTVGLLFNAPPSQIFTNIFYARVMEGLEESFYRHDTNLLLGTGRAELLEGRLPKFIQEGAADLLVLLGHFSDSILELLINSPTPIFLLDSLHPTLELDCLTSDGRSGAEQVVNHLVGLGHKRIAMLAYADPDFNSSSRVASFRATVKRKKLAAANCPVFDNFHNPQEILPTIDRLLAEKNAPTAIFCVNDVLAMHVLAHLTSKGISVPNQLSLVGFDDDRIAADSVPSLTTVRIETGHMGQLAGEMVFERLNNPRLPARKVELPVELVVRDSTAPPPSAS